jgi:heme/copper-type cytochrome/quinol oxidase subunit 3
MTVHTRDHLRVVPEPRRMQLLPNAVFGMLIFVIAEAMLFAGLISAFVIVRSGAPVWPPPGQPRLPVEETAVNTAALLLSGVLLFFAGRAFRRREPGAKRWLLVSIGLGAFFVIFQGVEWLGLIREGLTLTSSPHGSFFYLIVGAHALHAMAALVFLGVVYARMHQGPALTSSAFAAARVFWYFVVGLWPILYLRVYL